MKRAILGMVFASAIAAAAEKAQTFTGVITDTMCGTKHTMGIKPDDKCVRECVKMDPKKWKYALLVGNEMYVLSDQQTPEKFAAQKVKVTGTLYEKTKILKADKIEAAE
jgi:3-methyladenine DNA glycosylase AlkD